MEEGFKNPKALTAAANPPEDVFRAAYMLHFVLGSGMLLPWNALITAVDYFGYLYPDRHVEKVFSVAYMASSLVVLGLMLSLGWCRRVSSLRTRLNVGFCMFVAALMATPSMQWVWHDDDDGGKMSSGEAYRVVVGSVLVCGLADGLIGGSLIGSAGMLPKKYMQAVFAGTASSGVLISILRIVTKASLPRTPRGLKTSAQFYFILSAAILIGCIICCNILHQLPVMRHHRRHRSFHYILSPYGDPSALWEVLAKIKFPGFGVFLIYTVTLSIFPGFLSDHGVRSELLGDWYPIALIAAYNVSDFAGKLATGVYVVKGVGKAAWGCVARLVFYPLFAGCFRGPAWLRTEIPVAALTVLLGFSNGYFTSAVMIMAPKAVAEAEAEVAAVVMAAMLGVGLVAGSVVGWLWII
ncbi:equilibrative nucleotide transporter 8 [Andrographis paniculata]|uniref:equilibrative nucleotide transporter 8 n=1 Tax=Andrographis paniculata TaxID=175694 RepID=UPI0021E7C133|nr:equilibrative nucleotide transporter 8 [Andrographis paniculata]